MSRVWEFLRDRFRFWAEWHASLWGFLASWTQLNYPLAAPKAVFVHEKPGNWLVFPNQKRLESRTSEKPSELESHCIEEADVKQFRASGISDRQSAVVPTLAGSVVRAIQSSDLVFTDRDDRTILAVIKARINDDAIRLSLYGERRTIHNPNRDKCPWPITRQHIIADQNFKGVCAKRRSVVACVVRRRFICWFQNPADLVILKGDASPAIKWSRRAGAILRRGRRNLNDNRRRWRSIRLSEFWSDKINQGARCQRYQRKNCHSLDRKSLFKKTVYQKYSEHASKG